MTDRRYPTAVEREAAKRLEEPAHPGDRFDDPFAQKLADVSDHANAKTLKLKRVGGSNSDSFNICLANSVLQACWDVQHKDQHARLVTEVGHALAAIDPADEVEGMLAAQMIAAHMASMECFRRAMLPEQSVDGRALNLNQANKASRTYVTLFEALDKHRGKGQQRVVVEHVHRHVHVHEDSSKTVDRLSSREGGVELESRRQS